MARINYVKKSRVGRTCTTYLAPSHNIPVGSPLYYAAPGFRSGYTYRCIAHPFQPSELTTSLASEPMRAQEEAHRAIDAATTMDDLEAIIDDFTQALQDYVDAREEALDAWENGNSQLEELRDQAQEALDAVEGQWQPDDFEGDDPDEDEESEDPSEWDDYFEEQREAAHALVDEAML